MEKQNLNLENNKRMRILAAGTFMSLFLGLLYAWSIFASPLRKIYPTWTNSNISFTFTISMISFCIGGFVSGTLSKKFKSKLLIWFAASLLFVGFFSLSRLNPNTPESSLKMLYLLYGVICGSGVGIGYNWTIASVNKWFPDKVGFSSGIMLMGFAFGGLILGSIVKVLTNLVGLMNTFLFLAFGVFVFLILGSLLINNPKEGEVNFVSTKTSNKENLEKSFTPNEMVKNITFWWFFLWTVTIGSSGLLVVGSAAVIAESFGAPALLGLLVSVFNGIGRAGFGQIFDKYGYTVSMTIDSLTLILSGIFLTMGSIFKNVVLVFVGLLLVGLAYGGSPSMTSSVIHSFYGGKNYSANFSLATFSVIPAAIIGPMISSFLLEKFNGNYTPTFIMIIMLGLTSFVLKTLLFRSRKKMLNN